MAGLVLRGRRAVLTPSGVDKPLVNSTESLFDTGERIFKFDNFWAILPLTRRRIVAISFLATCGSGAIREFQPRRRRIAVTSNWRESIMRQAILSIVPDVNPESAGNLSTLIEQLKRDEGAVADGVETCNRRVGGDFLPGISALNHLASL